MASPASATCTLLRPPRVHSSLVAPASPLPVHVLSYLGRRPRSLTTICAAAKTPAAVQNQTPAAATRPQWTSVKVKAIGPATADKSIFLITLDLSGAPDLEHSYTTPGQYLLTRVPSQDKKPQYPAAYMCISSAPGSGPQFDLLVRSVPGTTSELLCKLRVGDVVELGSVRSDGFHIKYLYPLSAAETMLLWAVGEGISPIRSLIESGMIDADHRDNVTLYYAAKDLGSMPYQERFNNWKETGVKVVPITQQSHTDQIHETILEEHNLHEIIKNPLSTAAVIVAPTLVKEIMTALLHDFGVPDNKILTIEWSPADPFAPTV